LRWLALSVGLSIVLTVLANVWLRASPSARRRVAGALEDLAAPRTGHAHEHEHDRRLRVIVPWKAMLVASLALTIVINLVLLAT
jgi:hypothetical protein